MTRVDLKMNRLLLRTLGIAFGVLLCCLSPMKGAGQSNIPWDTAKVWTDYEAALQRPERVWRLDLSKQKWKAVDIRLRRFRQLREIVLDKNKIDSLPPWMAEFEHLERLSIRSNKLTQISESLLGLSNLRELDLSDNEIEGIPEDIDALTKPAGVSVPKTVQSQGSGRSRVRCSIVQSAVQDWQLRAGRTGRAPAKSIQSRLEACLPPGAFLHTWTDRGATGELRRCSNDAGRGLKRHAF